MTFSGRYILLPSQDVQPTLSGVELDSTGPIRIESLFPMGESGNIFSPHFRSMNKLFDSFEHRPFPLFD